MHIRLKAHHNVVRNMKSYYKTKTKIPFIYFKNTVNKNSLKESCKTHFFTLIRQISAGFFNHKSFFFAAKVYQQVHIRLEEGSCQKKTRKQSILSCKSCINNTTTKRGSVLFSIPQALQKEVALHAVLAVFTGWKRRCGRCCRTRASWSRLLWTQWTS